MFLVEEMIEATFQRQRDDDKFEAYIKESIARRQRKIGVSMQWSTNFFY